jgi:hypothetical protein
MNKTSPFSKHQNKTKKKIGGVVHSPVSLRSVDHTSYSRSLLARFNQRHGLLLDAQLGNSEESSGVDGCC